MNSDARLAFIPFTDRYEGKTNFFYTDSVGLVTIARGYLVDSGMRREKASDPMGSITTAAGCALPMHRPDGGLASAQEISAEWLHVKNMWPSVQSFGCASITNLRLDWADVDALTFSRLDTQWAAMKLRWPQIDSWPSTAQLGVASMAWAGGPGFNFPKFAAAALVQDWKTCAVECQFTKPPVPQKRNAANVKLFAGAVAGLDLTTTLAGIST